MVPGFSGLAPAGAMGSQLFSAPPLLSFSPWPPQSLLSPAAMDWCAPYHFHLPEIPWCGPKALRAFCHTRNIHGPCLPLCLPPSTNKCNVTQMRNLPLSPPTHSATATKPVSHSPTISLPCFKFCKLMAQACACQVIACPMHVSSRIGTTMQQPARKAFLWLSRMLSICWRCSDEMSDSSPSAMGSQTCRYGHASETAHRKLPCRTKLMAMGS